MPIPEFVADIRRTIGTDLLWLPAVSAVVVRDDQVLLVQRADNLAWTVVTGILDPGEEPALGAVREVLEETGVGARATRLAGVTSDIRVTYDNGDRAVYLDLCFACSWESGEPYVADDESIDARWWPLDGLPELSTSMLERIDAALSDEVAARFNRGAPAASGGVS